MHYIRSSQMQCDVSMTSRVFATRRLKRQTFSVLRHKMHSLSKDKAVNRLGRLGSSFVLLRLMSIPLLLPYILLDVENLELNISCFLIHPCKKVRYILILDTKS